MWEFARPFCKAMCSYINPLKASQNQTKLGKTIEVSNRGLALTTFQQGAESMHRQKKGKRACNPDWTCKIWPSGVSEVVFYTVNGLALDLTPRSKLFFVDDRTREFHQQTSHPTTCGSWLWHFAPFVLFFQHTFGPFYKPARIQDEVIQDQRVISQDVEWAGTSQDIDWEMDRCNQSSVEKRASCAWQDLQHRGKQRRLEQSSSGPLLRWRTCSDMLDASSVDFQNLLLTNQHQVLKSKMSQMARDIYGNDHWTYRWLWFGFEDDSSPQRRRSPRNLGWERRHVLQG